MAMSSGRERTGRHMKQYHEQRLSVTPYLALSRDLSALLAPAPPDARFRAELHRSLVDRARREQLQPALLPLIEDEVESGLSRRVFRRVVTVPGQDRRWVWGAAAVGSAVSLAGLVTYVWHRRGSRAA